MFKPSSSAFLLALLLTLQSLPAQNQGKAGGWNVTEKPDEISRNQIRKATLSVPANYEGRLGKAAVTATCGTDEKFNGPYLALEVAYHSNADKDLGIETSGLDASILPDFATAMGAVLKSNLDAITNPQAMYENAARAARNTPVVRFRVRVDDAASVGYSRSNYPNVLTIYFFDGWSSAKVLKPPYGSNQLPPVASVKAGLAAKHIKVELPVANSDRPVIDLDVSDPRFHEFATRCVASESAKHYDPNGTPSATMADGYVLGTMESYSARTTLDTAGGFAVDFPNFLRKAMSGSQMRRDDYAKETAYIQQAVRACGSITPEMVQRFTHDGNGDPSALGERFKPCALGLRDSIDVTDAVKGYSAHKRRGIRMWIRPDDGRGDRWGTGHRFDVEVHFDPVEGDPDIGFGKDAAYLIVIARLTENSVGVDGGAPPRDHLQDARNHLGLRQYPEALADYKLTLLDKPDDAEAKAGVAAIEDLPRRRAGFVAGLSASGVWLDTRTNLMWTLKDSDQDLHQSESYLYCANLKAAALSDWRLPVLRELQGIYDARATAPIRIKGGITLRNRAGWVWAQGVETTRGQNLRFFSFQTGGVHDEFAYNYASFAARAICVRPYEPDVDGVPNPLVAPVAQGAAKLQPTTPAAPSPDDAAGGYYLAGKYSMERGAVVDPKTGKLFLPEDCKVAFQKYLELAPDGRHVRDVKKIFESAGIQLQVK